MDEKTFADAPASEPKPSFFAKDRPWLNISLFLLTVVSAFTVGLSWSASYQYAEELGKGSGFNATERMLRDPRVLLLSLLYAAVLLAILLGHELGHYLTCRRYRISATWPFFIPAPTLIGTMGAFIKIRSPISRKRELFDIGIAGPVMSFVLAIPALIVGMALSKVVPALPPEGTITFGDPLLLKLLAALFFKNVGSGHDLILHPVAVAGWVGLFVTALNLFPIGQLDGGHVFYAFFGPRAKLVGRVFLVLFFILGIFFWFGWIVWALLIMLLGVKHPRIQDEETPLGRTRKIIGLLAIVMFVLSFIPAPIQGYNLFDVLRIFRR